ncbi:hypothetical protein [Thioalkalivibrio sp. XN279]|uniref:hypothetical protein n=1 Tax=Thioalkalivibrio sp. XN279 TaxID=2714953 RepID=UPI0014098BEA|nr:hypothetical protein [Thioalkalivibrio sp. XN279]NHA14604.1 hypothetical protein [Thioalkalivibrio sp. XN279]
MLQMISVDYRTRQSMATSTGIHITAHALERLATRGKKLSVAAWADELKPALLALFFMKAHFQPLVDGALVKGRGCVQIPTRSGHARAIFLDGQVRIVTWLHDLDLSDHARHLAALEWASLVQWLAQVLGIRSGLTATSYQKLMDQKTFVTEGK